MGCCKSKVDENANINYDNEDELPSFEPNNIDKMRSNPTYDDKDEFSLKAKGGLHDNPKFNKTLDEEKAMETRTPNSFYNGGKNAANFNYHLILSVKESKFLLKDTKLEITPKGLIGSNRNADDGIVYFGLHNLEVKNDFCFKPDEGVNKQHFMIKFDSEKLPGYYVKNLNGSGVFIKINEVMVLKDGMIISFGTNHLVVSISTDYDQKDTSNIKFKSIYGPNRGGE